MPASTPFHSSAPATADTTPHTRQRVAPTTQASVVIARNIMPRRRSTGRPQVRQYRAGVGKDVPQRLHSFFAKTRLVSQTICCCLSPAYAYHRTSPVRYGGIKETRMNVRMKRVLTLDRWLRQGRRVVAKDAAQELGVDERTIRRDLKEIMEGQWKLPIKYDRSQRVWFYDGDATALPATIISSADRLALLLSLQSVEQYRGTPIHGQLKALYARLLELLMPETRTSYETLAAKIRFEGPPLSLIAGDVWNALLNSLETNETVIITYKTGRSGETRKRSVDPYGLVCRHREWHLIGWDHYRRGVRTFFLPRIAAIEYTEKTFRLRGGFVLDDYLSTAVDSHQSTGPIHHVVLRWNKESAHLGGEFVWNSTQKVSKDSEGRVTVEFDTGALYAVERQVLGWGGIVEVLEPGELRRASRAAVVRLMSTFGVSDRAATGF